jgi:hypothetical protein
MDISRKRAAIGGAIGFALVVIVGIGAGYTAFAAPETLNPCAAKTINPCAAKTINPCAAKTLNPCAAKTLNPCAAKTLNPCAAKTLNPCAARTLNPCAARTLNPCAARTLNPCAAKTLNPCLAKTLNPCAAKTLNPCAAKGTGNPCADKNPCNPCGAGGMIDSSRFVQPEAARLAGGSGLEELGEKLWNDRSLGKSGLACANCHIDSYGQMQPSFAKPYPHAVAMPRQMAGVEQVNAAEMVQFCMVQPMATEPFDWSSRELAALTAWVQRIQPGYEPVATPASAPGANPCNPCGAGNPCNPCSR